MKIIKDFLEYRRFINLYQEIELKSEEKIKLEALGSGNKDILNKVLIRAKNILSIKVLSGELSVDEAKGGIFAINYIKGIIK